LWTIYVYIINLYCIIFLYNVIFLGKGTQCQLLSERLQAPYNRWVHLSAGDLLRLERQKSNSILADEINSCINAGQLVPSNITCQLLVNAMIETYHQQLVQSLNSTNDQMQPVTHFLIDGFPRSQSNLDAWNEMTSSNTDKYTHRNDTGSHDTVPILHKFTYHVRFILNYTCPEETLIGRILERGKVQSRSDDNISTIQARFRTFYNETTPILQYYQNLYHTSTTNEKKGTSSTNENVIVPVYTIQTDQPVEMVYQQTIQYFQK
jgi:UMP-CMP kinase